MKKQTKYITFGIVLCFLAGCIAPTIALAYIPEPIPNYSVITDFNILDWSPGYPSGTVVSGSKSSTYINNGVYLIIRSSCPIDDNPVLGIVFPYAHYCNIDFYFNQRKYSTLIFDWKVTGVIDNFFSFAGINIYYTSGYPDRYSAKEGYRTYNVDSSRTIAYVTFCYATYWEYSVVNQYFDYIKMVV